MKRVRYSKYTGDLASEMDLEDLLQALSDFLLDSGFQDHLRRTISRWTARSMSCAKPFARP